MAQHKNIKILTGTKLKVICNSGAAMVRVYKVYKAKQLSVGTIIQASVISINKSVTAKVKRKDKVFGVIVHLKKHNKRVDGTQIRFSLNSIVLVKAPKDTTMIGNRINFTVPAELHFLFPNIVQASLGMC